MPNKKLSTAHEVNHALNAELEFKAEARRNKLLGYWLAEQMGMDEAASEAYAREVVISDLEEPGIEDLVRKVTADIKAKSLSITDLQVRDKIEQLLPIARGQIEGEAK